MLQYLFHIGELIKDGKDVQSIIANIAAGKEKLPSKAEVDAVIADVYQLVDEGLISIPNVAKADLEAILKQVQASLDAVLS